MTEPTTKPQSGLASASRAPEDTSKPKASDSAEPDEPEKQAATGPATPARSEEREERGVRRSSAPPDPSVPPLQASEAQGLIAPVLALLIPALFFFALPPLTKSGLWDPFELNVADLARRVALNLLHADALSLSGADNSLPHLNDLGRPQLPISSVALGFKLFGLHEWAGRAPLALWGLAGVAATYAFVAKLVDRRAGLYAAIALTTMPLYFVQARTILGDIVTMSALAMSFGGLAVTVFDRDAVGPTRGSVRLPWLLLALVGLVAGFESRGGVLGVSVPLLGVGLAWALTWAAGGRKTDPLGDAVGGASLALGIGVLALGLIALSPEVQNGAQLWPLISIGQTKPSDLNLWVGAMVKTQAKYPTFDYYIGHLGPALAPWSAFAPFAMGRLFVAPVGRTGFVHQRESFTRMALLVGSGVALAAHAWLAARTDLIAFCAPAIIAAACGIALRDFERGAHASIAVGVGTAVLLALFHHDFHELPEKAYQAFAVVGATFPDSFKDHALLLWTVALVGCAGVMFVSWVERDSDRVPFDPKRYFHVLKNLREAWDGLLALAFFAMVAGASIAGLAIWVGVKTHAKWLPTISLQIRDGVLNAWWATAFVPLGIIFGVYFACDVWLWAFRQARPFSAASFTRGFEPFEELYAQLRAPVAAAVTAPQKEDADAASAGSAGDGSGATPPQGLLSGERLAAALILVPLMALAIPAAVVALLLMRGTRPVVAVSLGIPSGVAFFLFMGAIGDLLKGSRAAFLAVSGVAFGFVLCFFYYPALANQLSPKEVFESYQRTHKDGEPLALLGVGGRTAAYYAGGQPPSFNDSPGGYAWLMGGEGQRRFLAIKAEELPKLNQLYRERSQPRQNLPVLDARSSQILLCASSLNPGDKSQNPLGKILLSAPPSPQHRLLVNMDDKLEVTGYDVTDQSGRLVDSIAPGRKYRMRTYYHVLAPVTTEWEAFIHIDGYHRRHNGDHKPMDGKYPFSLWLKDDLLVDDYEFGLEPNFTPGAYTIFFGLFVGETRLKVKSGPQDGENRINGGQLRVQ
jgi:4-amino-4-deoxy-L-arabinose transferase-like glycosyltransferase